LALAPNLHDPRQPMEAWLAALREPLASYQEDQVRKALERLWS